MADQSTNANHLAGIELRRTAANNYYHVYLSGGNTLTFRKVIAGTATTLGSTAFAYTQGTRYWIKVVATGSTFAVYTAPDVAGSPGTYTQRIPASGTITDASIATGQIGLRNVVPAGATRRAAYRGPTVTQTMPQDWGGIVQTAGHPGAMWDKTTSHAGSGSMRVFSGDTTFDGYAAQTTNNTAVVGGTTYVASGWLQTTGMGAGSSATIVLVEQPSGTTTVVGAAITANATWTQRTAAVALQGNTTSVDTRVRLVGRGAVNFDDVAVFTATPTPTFTPTSTFTPTFTATPTSTFTFTPTPTPTNTTFLHSATTTVGSTSYLTSSTSAPSGTLATLSGFMWPTGTINLADGSNRSIFVSSAVPAGQSWDLNGTWTFSTWVRASGTGAGGYAQASVYRIDSSGVPYLLYTTPDSPATFDSTTWSLVSWTGNVPVGSTLSPGERYGVELKAHVTNSGFVNAQLNVDTSAYDSRFYPIVTVNVWTATPTPTMTPTGTLAPTLTPTITNTPVPSYYLHAATTTVGSTTYDTITTGAPNGTLTTLSAAASVAGYQNFADSSGRSIFVSSAVPAGQNWDLGGVWTFNVYTRASNTGATGYLEAVIYKIDASGNAYQLATTGLASTNALFSTSYSANTWTYFVPSGTTLAPSERWGVQFVLDVTSGSLFVTGYAGIDTVAQGSAVQPVIAAQAFTATPTSTPTITPGGPTLTPTATPTITNTPIPAYNLHNTTTTVGGTTYKNVNTTNPSGTQSTVTGGLTTTGAVTLADGSGRSVFVSGAVPSGVGWDLGGTWTFNVYTDATGTGATGFVRANIYRISSGGAATLLYSTADASTNAVGSTSYQLQTWTFDVPSGTMLATGERWGVEFVLDVTVNAFFQTANLAFDTVARQSRVQPAVTSVAWTATPTVTSTPTQTRTPTRTPTPGGPTDTPTVTPTTCPYVCDTFGRADSSTSLGAATSGQAWQVRASDGSVFGICSQAACAKTVSGEGAYAAVNAGLTDYTVQASLIQPGGTTATGGLVLRARSDWSRFLLAEVNYNGSVVLWRYNGGYWSSYGSSTVTLSSGATNTLAATAYGSTIYLTWNGSPISGLGSVTDIDDASGTYAGIYVGSSTSWPTLDDFSVAPPSGVPPTPVSSGPTSTATPTSTGPTPTPWTTGASDSFNRADSSSTLGRADSGRFWTTDGSVWGTCSNRACVYGPPDGNNYVRIETNLTDQRASVTIPAQAQSYSGQVGLIARVTSDWNTNLLYVGIDAAGEVEVWTLVNAAWNGPIATGSSNVPYSTSRTLLASTSGTSLTIKVNNTTVAGLSGITIPAAPANATYAGMYVDTASLSSAWPKLDSFSVVAGP